MFLSRAFTKSIGRLLIGVLLFAQLAVASYACPGLKGMAEAVGAVEAVGAAAMLAAEMPPGCDQMDADTPNLCAAHCQQGQQSADTASAAVLALGLPSFLYSIPPAPQSSLGAGRFFPAADAGLDAAPEPPHAILHCVFRL